jgi:hypothetical protein
VGRALRLKTLPSSGKDEELETRVWLHSCLDRCGDSVERATIFHERCIVRLYFRTSTGGG